MTHEVQGRMLLREWFAWWDAIPRIDAEARLGDYNIMLLGTSGWEIKDRPQRLESLIRQAYGELAAENSRPTETEAPDQAVHQQMRSAYMWLSQHFGQSVIARGRLN